ncbi:DUF4037 domain-containing protein [Streptomyces griseorubiginosus]|uniref:DUF4037 domain-containing protein n=1 Tax=Streptomyces griseorubiginosus TaxID=67304 RepID=UPI002E7FFC60|nr:DUF4037 domain-containing protein [Streptomyces griseorubiginosus]WUB46113.1 DUF4037 domain-containing protein [Streptomyces griseorubiginosus]WUB54634.1 DUF4037 domain-containing protein [Streptomyces griseorubiginosus]
MPTPTPRPSAPGPFLPGLELARRFYTEAVRPLLADAAPGIPYSAARIGPGSEVLGYDTPRSADHEWGPRLQLFLHPEDAPQHAARIREALAERLPKTFHGWPTNFAPTGEPRDIRVMRTTDGPVHHRVEITDIPTWFQATLGFDPTPGITPTDWLTTPTQNLAEVTAGAVFHDGLKTLVPLRKALTWYPHDTWLRVLATHWQAIADEEAFVGRCGEVGDELGSAVVTASLTGTLMRLCLLMNRRYPPYAKWLGTAFTHTPEGSHLTPVLTAAVTAPNWRTRETHLTTAYETLATLHNQLRLTDRVDPTTRPYHSRPFRVLRADRFAEALLSRANAPEDAGKPRSDNT